MLKRRFFCLLWVGFAGLLLLATGPHAWAQNATISGIVTDSSGAVLPNAQEVLLNRATQIKLTTVSNSDGVYTLAGVTPGAYDLTITANGFKTEQRTGIIVNVGAKISLDVQLSVGAAGEQVTVNGGGENIDTTDASVSTVVDRQFVENLPLNGRSFQSLITVAPGTEVVPSQGQGSSGEISVNGQRTEANYFTVDGVSANTGATVSTSGFIGAGFSGATPQNSALGTTQSIISIDALQEFRESTSTYSAEYGRTPGGQFSFISRSGTNQFHGSAYDFLRNDAMDAKNFFDTTKLPERQNDFGGTLGGPIWIPHVYNGRDKTFFFFSEESLRLVNPQASQTYEVPSNDLLTAAASLQSGLVPYLDAFPVSNVNNGADLGGSSAGLAYFTSGYSAPNNLDDRNIRVDHTINDRFKLFGRYTDVPSYSLSREPSDLAQVNNTVRNVKMAVLGLDTVLSPAMVNELRFGLTGNDYKSQRYLDNFGGATPLDIGNTPGLSSGDWMTFFLFYGTYPYFLIEPQSNRQRQINVVDTFTHTLGRHTLKYGVDYRRLLTSEELPPLWEITFYYDEADVLANAPAATIVYTQAIDMKDLTPNYSFYGQDEWKITDRWNASLGLRWDINPAPTDLNGNQPYTVTQITNLATTMAAPKGTALWKTQYNAFAPRIGLAYQARRTPGFETVVRAGGGIFYDTGTTQSAQGYYGIGTTAVGYYSTGFPATQAEVQSTPLPDASALPYNAPIFAYDPNLKLPYTEEWNLAVEQELGTVQSLTLNYVGSAGRRQLVQREYFPEDNGNMAFSAGNGLYITNNAANSNYHALQVRFDRKMAQGLQFLAAYTWAHAIDTGTSNFLVYTLERGNSDYDIRHNFQAALSYEVGGHYANPYVAYALKHWAVDSRISARSALPVDVTQEVSGVTASGEAIIYHPDRVAGQPLYVSGSQYPGGRAINYAAFSPTMDTEGDAGRNIARGFDAVQVDMTLRRDFPFKDQFGMEFRIESYNLFNHPIFGSIYNSLSSGPALFGQAYNTENSELGGLGAIYQVGGPRSLQASLKLHF